VNDALIDFPVPVTAPLAARIAVRIE